MAFTATVPEASPAVPRKVVRRGTKQEGRDGDMLGQTRREKGASAALPQS